MKLRNKKTGEIAHPDRQFWEDSLKLVCEDTNKTYVVNTIAELNAEWEDYDDTEDHWCINFHGEAKRIVSYADREEIAGCKQIGNYFETREEAEKAVRKLKAVKRLKDKGFSFSGVEVFSEGLLEIDSILPALKGADNVERLKIIDDLDLLFCTEENS